MSFPIPKSPAMVRSDSPDGSSMAPRLGAPWVAHLLTVQQMSASASRFVFVIVCATVFATVGVISGQATARGLVRWSTILFVIGSVLYSMFNDTFGFVNWQHGALFESFGGILFAISIGLSLGELVALAADGRSLVTYLPHWVGPLLVAALFQGPQAFAGGVAKVDGSVPSHLPAVTLVTPDGHQWMMIGPAGDQLLLISPSNDVRARVFRLVAPSMIAAIGTPPRSDAEASNPNSVKGHPEPHP